MTLAKSCGKVEIESTNIWRNSTSLIGILQTSVEFDKNYYLAVDSKFLKR